MQIKKTGAAIVAIISLMLPSLAIGASIGTLHTCVVFQDAFGNRMHPSAVHETLGEAGRLVWSPLYPSPTPSTGMPKNTLPYPFLSIWGDSEFFYNTDLDNDGVEDAYCLTYYSMDVPGNYYYEPINQDFAGPWHPAKYHDNFEPGVNTFAQARPYDASLFDSNPANDAGRVVRADGHTRLTNNEPEKWLIAVIKHQ